MTEKIIHILQRHGAVAVGFSEAGPVSREQTEIFERWLSEKKNAGMGYMANHSAIRRDPRLLLEGAATIISLAFPFTPEKFRKSEKGMIACYAYGKDYHDVIRSRLREAVEEMKTAFGGEYRICVDSAPIHERYWAVKSGIASVGCNGSVIVGEYGSMAFLAEIITTLRIPPDGRPGIQGTDSDLTCKNCNICVKACPAGAIGSDHSVDARRCLSYLTIEHRGDWTEPESIDAMRTSAGKNTIFGCDICLRACPLNSSVAPTAIEEFHPIPGLMDLSSDDIRRMSRTDFSLFFRQSPIKRAKFDGLKRNIALNWNNS